MRMMNMRINIDKEKTMIIERKEKQHKIGNDRKELIEMHKIEQFEYVRVIITEDGKQG